MPTPRTGHWGTWRVMWWRVGFRSTAASCDRRCPVYGEGRQTAVTTVSAERLATLFVDVADTLVDDFDVVEFLQMLTRRVAGLFGTGEAGLMLADERGRLTFMAASDESARLMEL